MAVAHAGLTGQAAKTNLEFVRNENGGLYPALAFKPCIWFRNFRANGMMS